MTKADLERIRCAIGRVTVNFAGEYELRARDAWDGRPVVDSGPTLPVIPAKVTSESGQPYQ